MADRRADPLLDDCRLERPAVEEDQFRQHVGFSEESAPHPRGGARETPQMPGDGRIGLIGKARIR